MDEPVYVVFNPHSGKGRGAQFVAPVLQGLAPAKRLEHGLTQGPGDEARLAEEAIAPRLPPHRRGGRRRDLEQRRQRDPAHRASRRALGLVPGGTGCDLAKTLGIPPRDVAALLPHRPRRRARARSTSGRIEDKHFLNIAGFGYDVAVLEDSWSVGYLEGSALYLYCALRQLRLVPGLLARGRRRTAVRSGKSDMLMLIVANARIFGGGFQVAPARRRRGRASWTRWPSATWASPAG